MDKEMKKLLLVAVSVGVFLIVTITAAILITTPNAQREAAIAQPAPYTQGRIQPAENIITNTAEQPVITNFVDIPEIVNVETPEPAVITDRNNGDSLTIQIPVISSAGVTQNNSIVTNPVAAVPVAVVRQTPAPAAAVSSVQSDAPSSAVLRPTIARTINDYWIQIGAYSAMVRAEDTRELLAAKGLVSIIENREVNGQNLFRVRLGPYTSEKEANHWLAIVKEIDGFSDSQVRQTTRQQ